jgi:hypothetical protein
METIKIELTKPQVDSAKWLLGCPLFSETDAASLSHDWDVTIEQAELVISAAKLAKLEGQVLTIPQEGSVINYLHEYVEQLEDMSGNEYLDELIGKGIPHREAQCKVNAAVQSVESLKRKIAAHLSLQT